MSNKTDGCRVQHKDRPGVYGVVSKSAASAAGLIMNNPEWNDDTTVFVAFDDPSGINVGWFNPDDLELVDDDR